MRIFILSVFTLLFAQFSFAQFQYGEDLLGDLNQSGLGVAVALSEGGHILAAGSRSDAVKVYYDNGTEFLPYGGVIYTDQNGGGFGTAVDLSNNGSIIAIGSYQSDVDNSLFNNGSTRIFQMVNNDWVQMGSTIQGSQGGEYSGISVALNGPGNILAVSSGTSCKLYEFDGNDWVLRDTIQGTSIVLSVSLSFTGDIVAIGNSRENNNTGMVRIYNYNFSSNVYEQLGDTLNGENINTYFGCSVALGENGDWIVVGSFGDDTNGVDSGAVKTYTTVYTGNWQQRGQTIYGIAEDDKFGARVSFSRDKMRFAANAPKSDKSGQVRIFDMDWTFNNWEQAGTTINRIMPNENFGGLLNLSKNGERLVTSTPNWVDENGYYFGKVQVYEDLETENLSVTEQIKTSFKVYPNPTQDILHLASSSTIKELNIYTSLGQLVLVRTNTDVINIESLKSGLYFLSIKDTAGQEKSVRIIKQ